MILHRTVLGVIGGTANIPKVLKLKYVEVLAVPPIPPLVIKIEIIFSSNEIHSSKILIDKPRNPKLRFFLVARHWEESQAVVVVGRWWKRLLGAAGCRKVGCDKR